MNPAASSACRIAPTRPSIMSDGATMSAPASAWLTAARASSAIVRSLSTSSPARMPQWPWFVYSQAQTSVITRRSGACHLIARTASCTTPCGSQAPLAWASFVSGIPNRSTAGMPSDCNSSSSRGSWSTESWNWSGIERISRRTPLPWVTNSG